MATDDAKTMLAYETRAMLARLALVKPFALQESMLPAAALLPTAQVAIDRFLVAGRRDLRRLLHGYLQWLHSGTRQRLCSSFSNRCGPHCAACSAAIALQRWPGSCGSAGSRKSSPISGRWRASASPQRLA